MKIAQVGWRGSHYLFADVAVHNGRELRKQRLGWDFRAALLDEIARQRSRYIENEFLHAKMRAAFVHCDLIHPAWPKERRTPTVVEIESFNFHLRGNLVGLDDERGNILPVHRHAVAHRLSITFHTRETDLQARSLWQGMNVKPFDRWRRLSAGVCLEGHDLERHSKYFGYFLRHQTVWAWFVTGPAKTPADHLLARELRHERTQPDDVRYRAAIPALGKHSDADDATNIAARRMSIPLVFVGKVREAFGINLPALGIRRPRRLADGIEREAHPTRFVGFGSIGVCLVDDLRVNDDGVPLGLGVAKPFELRWGDAAGTIAIRKPVEDDVRQGSIFADENEDWRARLTVRLPLGKLGFPQAGAHRNGSVRPFEHGLGFGAGVLAAALGGSKTPWLQNPAPDIEVAWNLGARRVSNCELRNLHQPGLDGVHEAEVTHYPRERAIGLLADPTEEVRRR